MASTPLTDLPAATFDAPPVDATPWPRHALRWVRTNLFGSIGSTLWTLAILWLLWQAVPPLLGWAVLHATFFAADRRGCDPDGACWAFILGRLDAFFYGRYPMAERWRVDLAALVLAGFVTAAAWPRMRHRGLMAALLVTLCPVVVGVLLVGSVPGLPYVDTNLWGGLTVNVVLTFVAVAFSLPLGVLLALGRRSKLPIVRALSIGYIELWRGVPLLTVLFMAMVMLPMFLPGGVTLDRLVRAAIGLTLFTAAYMAEIVRAGLQGIDKGQSEAASALGLGYWRAHALIILPQAFRLVVPGIVNTVIDLFKDTTLVTIVGLFDLLGIMGQAIKDPQWLGLAREGYAFAAAVFFLCCLAMSIYSRRLEKALAASHRR